MKNMNHARAVKFGTVLCITLLSALITFTIRLSTHRSRSAVFALALAALAVLGGIGTGIIPDVIPNDAKDIWLIGI